MKSEVSVRTDWIVSMFMKAMNICFYEKRLPFNSFYHLLLVDNFMEQYGFYAGLEAKIGKLPLLCYLFSPLRAL